MDDGRRRRVLFWASVCLCGVMGRWTVFRFKLSVCLSIEGPTSQLGRHSLVN